jgi:GAF domain-containing protein
MRDFLGRLFTLRAYPTPVERERGRMVYAVTLFVLVFVYIYLPLGAFILGDPGFTANGQVTSGALIWAAVITVLGVLSLYSARRGWQIAPYITIVMFYIAYIVPIAPDGFVQRAPFVFLVLLGGALLGLYGALGMMFVAVFSVIGYIFLQPVLFPTFPVYDPLTLGYLAFDLLIALAFVYVFLRLASAREQQGELSAAQSRLQLAEITTTISGKLDRGSLSSLVTGAVDLIRDSYPDMYHVQIFLLDSEKRVANLAASTGEVGQLLLARAHALGVGSQSVIGQVSGSGAPLIARAGERGSMHRRNELLPETAVEGAFPLRVGENVIGVLDLQSRNAEAFSEEEAPIFQALADSVAIVIDNVRLNEETQTRLAENDRLLADAQNAMREVDLLNRELTGRGWQEFIRTRREVAFSYDGAETPVAVGADWTPTLAEAIELDKIVQFDTEDGTLISLPLRVRGQVIGAMEFEMPGPLEAADMTLLQQVTDRLGISLDSMRSFEQAREYAAQQERVSDISARYQQVNTVDELLRITLDELSDTLGANRGAIRLGVPAANGQATNGAH